MKTTLEQRFEEIVQLQKDIIEKFGDADYNIFLFGSYLTKRYIDGKSDIDIAVYADDFMKYLDIRVYLEEYFNNKGIKQDIFFVDTRHPARIFCSPLESVLKFTDYYPPKLKEFYLKCKEDNRPMGGGRF